MKCETGIIRSGYDQKKCFVHARCCYTPEQMLMTTQYLNVDGCDLFSGIYVSTSEDEGKTWRTLEAQEGWAPIREGDHITVACDGTPMYHRKTDSILFLGLTVEYADGGMRPIDEKRYTCYSVYDKEKKAFDKIRFLEMPEGYEQCGNGGRKSFG